MIHSRPRPRRRFGFTLVELLVVIMILGILVALLVPVIYSAVRTANDAQVQGEITNMTSALASFRNRYGEYPPSRILLSESGGYSVGSPPTQFFQAMQYADGGFRNIGGQTIMTPDVDLNYAQLAERSIRHLRKFFPRVQLSAQAAGVNIAGPQPFYDFNGNGVADPLPIYLQGHECLVFFLGGIPINNQGPGGYSLEGVSGFANNPTNPFMREYTLGGAPLAQNRTQPFYEFVADRLVDDSNNGIPGYIDRLGTLDQGRYFAYFSSYNGAGYDPNDVKFDGGVTGEMGAMGRPFTVSHTLADGSRVTTAPGPNPYTTGLPVPLNAAGEPSGVAASFANSESFQIISAGRDRQYGPGGQYDSSSTNLRLPGDPFINDGQRIAERDNITNFSNGVLE